MPTIVFVGTVFSGKGEGKKFISLPWVKSQIKEKLGFSPYAGTLNIRLNSESARKKILLGNEGAIWIEPKKGYCPGVMFKAQIADLVCCSCGSENSQLPKRCFGGYCASLPAGAAEVGRRLRSSCFG